jgi:hypothetical protein
MTIGTSDIIATAAALVAVLAWIEAFKARRIQETEYNFHRSGDIRIEQFQYWADRDLPKESSQRDELKFVVKNVGRAFASEMNFAIDKHGLLYYVQLLIGLPPDTMRELTVVLTPNLELGEQELLLRYRYDDYRRHWGEITIKVPDGSQKHYGQYRRPKIISARLDGSRNPAILESSVFLSSMNRPKWYGRFTLPYQRWRFRRDHPELFKDK